MPVLFLSPLRDVEGSHRALYRSRSCPVLTLTSVHGDLDIPPTGFHLSGIGPEQNLWNYCGLETFMPLTTVESLNKEEDKSQKK